MTDENKQQGYVKLWRSVNKNSVLQDDLLYLGLFGWLITHVNRSGVLTKTGRNKLAVTLKIEPQKLYKMLRKLESAGIIELQSTNHYTDIVICNWSTYQESGTTRDQPKNNQRTASQGGNATKVEQPENNDRTAKGHYYKNENENNNPIVPKGTTDADSVLLDCIKIVNPAEKPSADRVRKMKARLKDYTAEEMTAAAYQLSQSDWHKEKKQMSIDNLIAPSKIGRWYAAAQADGFKQPVDRVAAAEDRKAIVEQNRIEKQARNAALLAKIGTANNKTEEPLNV